MYYIGKNCIFCTQTLGSTWDLIEWSGEKSLTTQLEIYSSLITSQIIDFYQDLDLWLSRIQNLNSMILSVHFSTVRTSTHLLCLEISFFLARVLRIRKKGLLINSLFLFFWPSRKRSLVGLSRLSCWSTFSALPEGLSPLSDRKEISRRNLDKEVPKD